MFKAYGTGKMSTDLDVSHTLLSARPLNRLDCDTDMNPFKYYIDGDFQGNYNLATSQPHLVCVNSTYQEDIQMTSGICQGDSGGPLVHLDRLTGVTSYNYPPCATLPQVFTSTAHFLENNWITDNSDYSSDYEGFWCYSEFKIYVRLRNLVSFGDF